MRKSLWLVPFFALFIFLGCSDEPTGPDNLSPNYDESSNTLTVPNATIYTGGNEYNEEAPLSEEGLALIMDEDSSTYFYTPLQGDIDSLSGQKSIEALQLIFADRVMKIKWEETTSVNITFSSLSGEDIKVVNNAFRCAGVEGKKSSEPIILPSRTLFDVDLISLFKGEWNSMLVFNEKFSDTLYSPSSDTFYLYGGITKTVLWGPALYPYLADKFIPKTVEAFQQNPSLYARVNLADALDVIILPIRLVAGNSGASSFIEQLALPTLYDIVYEMLSGITTSQSGSEVLTNVFNTVMLDIPLALLSKKESNIKEKSGSKSVSIAIVLKALSALPAAAELYAGAYQSLTSETYAKWALPTSQGPWTTKADMPTARAAPGAETVNGKIYIIGGDNGEGLANYWINNEEYDPTTDTWSTKASMPTGRARMAISTVDNKIYVIGGGNGGFHDTNEVYNPSVNSWATKANLPHSIEWLEAETVNEKIYTIGGYNGNFFSYTFEYNPSTDQWSSKADMPTPRGYLNISAVNEKIYAIGGYNSNGYLSTNEEYDPTTDTWSTKANIPTARCAFATGVVNGKIYAIGGYNGTYLSTNEEYDPATNTWEVKTDMPTDRGKIAAGVVDGKIYIAGGYNGTNILSTNEEYDPSLDN